MSTNSECQFIERNPGKWFYVLEDYNAPKNAWDWKENATAYGPFSSEEKAYEHLRDNHANPGGHSVVDNTEHSQFKEGEVLKKLLDTAMKGR